METKLTLWTESGTRARPPMAWKSRQAKPHLQRVPGSALGDKTQFGELGRTGGGIASPESRKAEAGGGGSGVR